MRGKAPLWTVVVNIKFVVANSGISGAMAYEHIVTGLKHHALHWRQHIVLFHGSSAEYPALLPINTLFIATVAR